MRKGFEITLGLKRKLNKLAKSVGVKLNWSRAPGMQYNRKDIACKGQDASNILHDIAHYKAATPKARKYVDFGLGSGPDSYSEDDNEIAEEIYSISVNLKIEEKASALGIMWEKELGLNWQDTIIYHSWDLPSQAKRLRQYWKAFKRYKYEI